MLSKSYRSILRILFGIILFWTAMPKAQAKEPKVNNITPVCAAKQIADKDNLDPSTQKAQTSQKTQQSNEDEDTFKQDRDPCKISETSESAEIVEEPESSEESESPEETDSEDLNQSSNPTAPAGNEPFFPDGSHSSQPSISTQDSHNLNFSIEFGGSSSGSDEIFPSPEYSSPSETKTFSPELPLPPSDTGESFEQPTQFLPSPTKPQRKQTHKSRFNKKEHHKAQKLIENDKSSKRKRRSHKKPKNSSTHKADQDNKSSRKNKMRTRRNFLRQNHNARIRDIKSHRKPPRTHRTNQVQKHQMRRNHTKFYPIYQRSIKQIHTRFRRPLPTISRRFQHILRVRPQLHPRLRQHVTPRRAFRSSMPRLHRMHRRH
jgi:hypothetical protein